MYKRQALHGKKLPVYGDGMNIRDWLYVDDHAKGIDMVQEKGRLGETYNIGGHNEKRNIEIINIIIETLQEILPDGDPRKANVSKDLITYVEDRKGHDLSLIHISTGLHLRPAGILCKEAMQYKSLVTFHYRGNTANAKSVLSVLGACIKFGDEIEFVCEGDDEDEALKAMVEAVESGLGE